MEKENVCVEEKGAEQAVIAAKGMMEKDSCPTLGSAAPKKFKDADALARAYGALEAEFTRRSQRIKELEKEVEQWKSGFADSDGSGAEKLRKNAQSRRNAAKEFDKFVNGLGKHSENVDRLEKGLEMQGKTEMKSQEKQVKESVGQEEQELALGVETLDDGLAATDLEKDERQPLVAAFTAAENAGQVLKTEVLGNESEQVKAALRESKAVSSVVGERETLSSDELYTRVCADEKVRLRIIGEYLSSVGKSLPPLTAGGVGAMLAPPIRAKSIADAGSYALQYLKKPFEV
jgi:hypothetical protein